MLVLAVSAMWMMFSFVQLVCRPMFADDAICGYTRMVSIKRGEGWRRDPVREVKQWEDVTSSTQG